MHRPVGVREVGAAVVPAPEEEQVTLLADGAGPQSSSLASRGLEESMLQWNNPRFIALLVILSGLAAASGTGGWQLLTWGW